MKPAAKRKPTTGGRVRPAAKGGKRKKLNEDSDGNHPDTEDLCDDSASDDGHALNKRCNRNILARIDVSSHHFFM